MSIMVGRKYLTGVIGIIYRNIIKKFFFKFDAERVHIEIVRFGEQLGKNRMVKNVISSSFRVEDKALKQKIAGINFENPVGLAAGFDYEARLTQILPAVGFGFETVGSITNLPCAGNPSPQLGRLPKSKSLMVNKGFRNLGAKQTSEKLSPFYFEIPIGISVGKSNLPQVDTQKKAIKDIVKTFVIFEKSKVKHSYYELNISCPNLSGSVSFYPPKNLRELLSEIDKLHLKRPVFMKMPNDKTDEEFLQMLKTISAYSPKGVILSNLSRDRKSKNLNQEEVGKFPPGVGSFSGRPTFERSNELIKLTYEKFKDRFIIVGCGGIFSGKDAYEKISLGASLVQLITGMVFEGPQLISQINLELASILKKEGRSSISQIIGRDN